MATAEQAARGCPVVHADYSELAEACSYAVIDSLEKRSWRLEMERGGGSMLTLLELPLTWEPAS